MSRRAYGGNLSNWLIYELARHDAAVEPMIGQKDAGWIVRFRFRGRTYDFLARYRGGADWISLLERRRSILARLFHGQPKNVEFDAVWLIDAVLSHRPSYSRPKLSPTVAPGTGNRIQLGFSEAADCSNSSASAG